MITSRLSALYGQGLDDYEGLRIGKIIRYGQMDMRLVPLGNKGRQPLSRPPGQHHGRLAGRLVHDAQITPEDASAEAGSERLGAGLLGGIAFGIGGGARRPTVGFAALDLGEDPAGETLAIALERLLDPPDVDHVIAETNDH